jgi:hypothetical protein
LKGQNVSPDEINKEWGRPVWTCFHCKAESNLEWWNGLSVAVCRRKPECGQAYSALISRQVAEEEAYQDYAAQYGP